MRATKTNEIQGNSSTNRRAGKLFLHCAKRQNRKPEGKVWPLKKEYPDDRVLENLKKDSGVEWDKNALRHSFISYRLALVKSTAQVALECGTSEQKIFENYRELVEEKEAEKWFQIYKSVTKEEKPAKKRIKKQ